MPEENKHSDPSKYCRVHEVHDAHIWARRESDGQIHRYWCHGNYDKFEPGEEY
jgi:hypothetical protein